MVGERGEIFVPNTGGEIMNHHHKFAMKGGEIQ